jgi:iron complex outermembrane receptor protein
MVTRKPTGEFGGRVVAGVGNYGSYNGEIHLNLPAIANIAFKIDALVQHQDESVSNPLDGAYGWNYQDRVGGRVSAQWKPIDGLTLDIAYDRGKSQSCSATNWMRIARQSG